MKHTMLLVERTLKVIKQWSFQTNCILIMQYQYIPVG